MKTKLQIKSIFGNVLFEYETENNTIKKTVEEAVKSGVSLDGASLDGASLDGASLNYASLNRASLVCASLDGASLNYASLNRASLNRASLVGASLDGASLNYASLNYASLNRASLVGASLNYASLDGAKNINTARMTQFCKWNNSIIGNKIQIGCKTKTIEDWQIFFDSKEEYETKRDTQEFKQIQAIFESYKAYLNHLNS